MPKVTPGFPPLIVRNRRRPNGCNSLYYRILQIKKIAPIILWGQCNLLPMVCVQVYRRFQNGCRRPIPLPREIGSQVVLGGNGYLEGVFSCLFIRIVHIASILRSCRVGNGAKPSFVGNVAELTWPTGRRTNWRRCRSPQSKNCVRASKPNANRFLCSTPDLLNVNGSLCSTRNTH